MKRRYLALMMGLTLAAVPAGAYAQETETQEIVITLEDSEENEQTDVDNQEKEETLWGKVIAVSEDEITIPIADAAENMSEKVNGIETVSEENVMVELEEAEWTDILTDDLVKITLDEDGNAGIILIAMADQV